LSGTIVQRRAAVLRNGIATLGFRYQAFRLPVRFAVQLDDKKNHLYDGGGLGKRTSESGRIVRISRGNMKYDKDSYCALSHIIWYQDRLINHHQE
jgi:hypothetical protein